MKAIVMALFSGLLFAVGLALAGMTQPSKVIGFLDFFGNWDPSLGLVMGGAIAAFLPAFRIITKRRTPIFASRFLLPTRKDIDAPLVIGAAVFGAGWGLAGYCPGPGLASLGTGGITGAVFVVAMMSGMGLHLAYDRLGRREFEAASNAGHTPSPARV